VNKMESENKVPAIRFKRFSEAWTSSELGKLLDITSAARVHKNEWTDTGVPFFRTSDVVSIYKGKKNKKAYISLDLYKELSARSGSVKKDDLLVTGGGSIGIPYLIETKEPLYFKDADLLWLKNFSGTNGYFLFTFFSSTPFRKYISSISHIGTISHYTIEQAKITPIHVSKESKEQTKIGEYFQQLDTLIAQHQKKHDKLLKIKKSLLEKIFPKQGATEPAIRFKGFSGAWEEKPFGDSFSNIPNNTLSRADLNYDIGLAKNIHYGDVLIKFGEVLDIQNKTIPFVTKNEVVKKIKPSHLKNGDVIIADAAEDETVGKCTEVFNIKEEIVFSGLHTIAVRPIFPFSSKYLGYYLNSHSYHDQLLPLMQGTKVLSISKTIIQTTCITYPSCSKEQTKIGSLFKHLDSLLSQHQTQLTKLGNIKQACLAKMFV